MAPPIASFGICECTHAIYEHARSKDPGAPEATFKGCRIPGCWCDGWRASDGSAWPNGTAGIVLDRA